MATSSLTRFSTTLTDVTHHQQEPGRGDDPAGVSAGDPKMLLDYSLAGLIRDAARFVPEIASLAALLIGERPTPEEEIGFGPVKGAAIKMRHTGA
jgi:hypothetical protein